MPSLLSLRSLGRSRLVPRAIRGAALVLALMTAPSFAFGGEAASPWFTTQQGRVRLIAAEPTVGATDAIWLGLQFELEPHWKIYWRSPGDAGYPPRLDWTGSANLAGTAIAWPAPVRFSVSGLETMGYEGAVVLPISARLQTPGAPVQVRVALEYLTCEIICIPYETTLTLDLPAGEAAPGAAGFGALIARYRAKVPGDGGSSGLRLESASFEPGSKPALSITLAANPPLTHPDAFVEGPDGVSFGPPLLVVDEPGHPMLRVPVYGNAQDLEGLAGRSVVVTVVDGARALEAAAVPTQVSPAVAGAGLLSMVLVALLGGFILNFMPCVLPVLSLKLLGAVDRAGRGSAELRRGFLASAAGILLAFLGLAGAMIALRAAGVAVGWGLQFQQPAFLAAMAAITTLFAANLWGWFEISLLRFVADRASAGADQSSLLGNMATGVLATLLATPCSAPFLGTAVGFALAGTSLEILVIFVTLGLGLALPYVAVALAPGMARWLPRPGHWMIVLRRILGVALIGTSAWLIFVLSAETGLMVAAIVAFLMMALLFLLGAVDKSRPRLAGASLVILATLGVAVAAPRSLDSESPSADALWQPFDRSRIADLVGEGKLVFVDVTARWCLTCQVNKRVVLDRAAVRDRLSGADTVAMAADWTRPDAVIAAYLKSYGRYGIPFNAVYGPGAPQGIVLSELLTTSDVLSALERARGPARAAGVVPKSPPDGG